VPKEIQCTFSVDLDAIAGFLGTWGGGESLYDVQRGVFAGEVGTPRVLRLLEKYNIKGTWFIPGHSIETFLEQTKTVAQMGHEIGAHGYSHEPPVNLTRSQEEDILKRSIEIIRLHGGSRQPTRSISSSSTGSSTATPRPITTFFHSTLGWERLGLRWIIPSRHRIG
jgi:peptidoglycan/xylan/chitin deacetylase (PgdA/CDA1 family)